jgi:heat-inducible transcriptional repressor
MAPAATFKVAAAVGVHLETFSSVELEDYSYCLASLWLGKERSMLGTPAPERLDARTQAILAAIIQSFIQTAEPVGSRTISKRFDIGLSPATIRNVMSDLEELGFLEQPHTSAGRVPTDKGYRFYINLLRSIEPLSEAESAFIARRFAPYHGEVDEVMAETSRLLSEMSHYAGVVLCTFATTVFKRVEFVKVRERQVLAIFVMESGMVHNKLLLLDEEMTQDELHRISNYLNHEFAHQPLSSVRQQVLERMKQDKARYDTLVRQAMHVGEKAFVEPVESDRDIYLGGTANMMDQPEFQANVEHMKELFRAFEEKSRLISVLDKCFDEPGLNVIIGSETPFTDIHECSFVTHTYNYNDRTVGVLGVVGPKRMMYPRVMAIVEYTAQTISKVLNQRGD